MTRRYVAAIGIMSIVALLVACNPTPSTPPSSTGPDGPSASPGVIATSAVVATFDPAATPTPIAFEGLYVGNDVSVSGDETVSVVRSSMQCSALEHMIGAGEWSITGREARLSSLEAGDIALTILTLQNGPETALAWLTGGDACTARIARTTSAPLRVSGAATYDGPAARDLPLCVASGADVVLLATFRTPGGPNVQVSIVAAARTGTTRLDLDDVEVHVTRGSMTPMQLAGVLVEAFSDFDEGRFAEPYLPSEDSRASLDVATIDPFVATLHVTNFDGKAGAISLDAQVACHLPGGALRRAAEAAAVPPPSTPPGTPGPTLPPFAGAAPGTSVVTGSQIAGTYQMPSSDLDCYFDFDEGAWTIQTVGNADPTFYLYAFTGQEGGTTTRVSMGLIVGDGSNGRLLLFDTTISPPDGTAEATVARSGEIVSIVVRGRTSDGATLAANLSCAAG